MGLRRRSSQNGLLLGFVTRRTARLTAKSGTAGVTVGCSGYWQMMECGRWSLNIQTDLTDRLTVSFVSAHSTCESASEIVDDRSGGPVPSVEFPEETPDVLARRASTQWAPWDSNPQPTG